MAKILISSLGTGQKREGGYRKAKYRYFDQTIETPFISKALCSMLDIDRLYLIGTDGSIWDSVYKEFVDDSLYKEEIELQLYERIEEKSLSADDLGTLEQTIDTSLHSAGSRCFLIDYGLDDTQLWQNFEKYLQILDCIEDGDTVYIDISHAFRSLALMSFIMVQFGYTVKNKQFKIGGIFYGMLEAPSPDGTTPIVDLKILYELMDWIKAIDNFKNYANGDNIAQLLKNIPEYRNEYNLFNNYTNAMRIANMAAVKKNIQTIARKFNTLEKSKNPIVTLMSEEMREFITRLNKDRMSDFQLALAEWYCEHKHYALAYMALAESIISKACEVKGYPVTAEEGRNSAKKAIYQIDKALANNVYRNVSKIRNNIAHQLQKREDAIIADIQNLPGYIQQTKGAFASLQD